MSIKSNYKAIQSLFAKGLITYPRSNSNTISRVSIKALSVFAKNNFFSFDLSRGQKSLKVLAHESPTLTMEGVSYLKKNKEKLEQTPAIEELIILECIALLQIKAFVPKQTKTAILKKDLVEFLPENLKWIEDIDWQQEKFDNQRLNDFIFRHEQIALFNNESVIDFTPEQVLFETMSANNLGTPATKVANISKIQKLELFNDDFTLNAKGKRFSEVLSKEHTADSVKKSESMIKATESIDYKVQQKKQEQQKNTKDFIAKPVGEVIGQKKAQSVMPVF